MSARVELNGPGRILANGLVEQDEDLAAVREAVAEMEGGDQGIPFGEAFEELRRRHG
ncbi:MAG: hypothetical protein WD069_18370 [Planctomycetales bacterium]